MQHSSWEALGRTLRVAASFNYGFSQKFGWLNDRYGVSWQLNLAN